MPDKFKGTLTAPEAAKAMARGLRRAWPHATTTLCPLSDGGDGFTSLLVAATGGRLRTARVPDAAGRMQRAHWGQLGGDGGIAVVDTASSCGLASLPVALRQPGSTSSFGTGLLTKKAAAAGCHTIIVGLGGSATNDAGMGIAAAWGYRFFSGDRELTRFAGDELGSVTRIVPPPQLPRMRIVSATDVSNPLCGALGATHQFALQKGASATDIRRLEAGMRSFVRVVRRCLRRDASRTPGAGAAGGIGYGLRVFLGAEQESGFEIFRRYAGVDRLIRGHDLVITGEGCFDRTSLSGKGPQAVLQLARQLNRPAWAVFGRMQVQPRSGSCRRLATLQAPDDPRPPSPYRSVNVRRVQQATMAMALEEIV